MRGKKKRAGTGQGGSVDRKDRIIKMTEALVPWFRLCGRSLPWRKDPDPYHVWVSEIMLQQTRIETVIPYYRRFLQEIPDIRALAEADPEQLQKLWEGLGYYSRVRNLQEAARQIIERHGGKFPARYEDIRALRGIGDYTAGAIASICFQLPVPAVDGNVLRVLSRITGDSRPVGDEKIKKEVREELAACYPHKDAGILTEAIMELGEIVCIPNGTPDCGHCPCRDFCVSSGGGWEHFPVKAEKKARRCEQLTVLILQHAEGSSIKTALRKRPDKGLLAGLWELPNCPGHRSGPEASALAEEWGCRPEGRMPAGSFRHIFTHVEWEMQCWRILCGTEAPGFTWADETQLKQEISLPTAFRKILKEKDTAGK